MAWSTRRLADLAGTTVKTVRHYHAIGLLEEPARAGNGYKQYGTPHLVRLLQIGRLRELGMPLSSIAELDETGEAFTRTLRALDSQLAASIDHQQQLRIAIAELLRHRADPDVPAGFADLADDLTPADRAMVMISARIYDEQGHQDMRAIVAHHREADDAFDELASDATADEIRAVAARLAPVLRTIHEQYPHTRTPPLDISRRTSMEDLAQAVTDLYNPAQVEVLRQAYRRAREDPTDSARVAESQEISRTDARASAGRIAPTSP
ncbi:MerR family transcriptional regulator [Microbacterium sp. G2-8]|uniref:MerR family transcriptional regulator n=1 Tax=Microbacterium sp. G2-8 TaxID=2842454 RepID=UPI001C88F04B|nr:MerR family transcriptional regulator [Microbacterium sp. G2-8]